MIATKNFTSFAPLMIFDLRKEFKCSHLDACAIVGNAGHECAGFTKMVQIGGSVDKQWTGLNLFQWSGVRHNNFLNFCRVHQLEPIKLPLALSSGAQFLYEELRGAYAKVLQAMEQDEMLYDKVETFERLYEAAGKPAIGSRYLWAKAALGLALADRGTLGNVIIKGV